ncbi:MAG: tRNA (cytosine(32)/uridine(32)-2'-O)-methyltransferase TrmJ [Gammaproteobacteria bacterium]
MSLSHVRVVLIETSHPGNIGAVARAMKNMGLHHLYLVNPRMFPHADATARASGADDVLGAAQVCASLDEALRGCSLVFGASARLRTIAWPQLNPRDCAKLIIAESARAPLALLIGREHAGLTNEELERCNYLVNIPSNPDFSSLNIAAAVQVLVYEVYLAHLEHTPVQPKLSESAPATADELELLYAHMQQALTDIEFLDPANPRQLMRRLRRLFNRVHLDKIETNILRGILAAAQRRAKV